ncbi:MAG: hypothetical protein PHS54_06185 [Clostridia bacterium]|nr:hypothetical protein [Clostridia bacterium]
MDNKELEMMKEIIKDIIEQNNKIAKMITVLANHMIKNEEGQKKVSDVAKQVTVVDSKRDYLSTIFNQNRAIIEALNKYASVAIEYTDGSQEVFDASK